jgi:type VI secretion system protein ImpI
MLPLLVRIDDLKTGASQQYAFARSPVRIGRNPMNDIALDWPFISQWHGLVRFDDNVTEYFDLGSTNGTLANGYRVTKQEPVAVAGNVELRVLDLRFFCWRGPAPAGLLPSEQDTRESLGQATRTVVEAENRTRAAGDASVQKFPQLIQAVRSLKPHYDAYRQAWANLHNGIRHVLAQVPADLQESAVLMLQQEMGALAGEEEFKRIAEERKVALAGAAAQGQGVAQIVSEFARTLVPSFKLGSLAELEKFLVRAATMVETSARAFVELRKGHSQFGSEMAIRTVGEATPLTNAREPSDVISYLLDIQGDATARIQELTSAYADIMIHQVALLNGMMEGVRTLLSRLGPAEIERELQANGVRLGPVRLPRFLWPFRSGSLWKRFKARHLEYTEEERQLSSAVFGAEFARAYAAVAGDDMADKSSKMLVGKPG